MKKLLLLALATLLAGDSLILANGGASIEGVPGTGAASPSDKGRKTEGSIENEALKIDLGQESATVEVRYTMHNTGAKMLQDFFFPVERWGEIPGEEAPAPAELDNYQIKVDGTELKSSE